MFKKKEEKVKSLELLKKIKLILQEKKEKYYTMGKLRFLTGGNYQGVKEVMEYLEENYPIKNKKRGNRKYYKWEQ